jgi:DNA-binding response OmpR family regulator
MKANLLIVDDNEAVRTPLKDYFSREGFAVTVAEDGTQALAALAQAHPDLVILDVQFPDADQDGLEICRTIRQQVGQTVGIIMISGVKMEMLDQVVGLEVGADVYMLKPFETQVLLAQVRATLRTVKARSAHDEAPGWLVVDEYLRIHLEQRRVIAGGREVQLTRQEFAILSYLAQHPDKCCSRADLIEATWGCEEGVSDAALNTCIARLRAKIEPDPAHPRYIVSVHGVGYRFNMSSQGRPG